MSSTGRRGKSCVAFGCRNTHRDGVSLHAFPLNKPSLCRLWTKFVQTKRDKWEGPTKYSVLCSQHFSPECYPMQYAILDSMQRTPPKRRFLNEDAIPTIQSKTITSVEPSTENIYRRKYEVPLAASTPKRPRTAFIKRENARLTNQYEQMKCTDASSVRTSINADADHEDMAVDLSSFEQIPLHQKSTETRTYGTQLSYSRPKSRSVKIQVHPHVSEKGCQTRFTGPKMHSVAVQCNILKEDMAESAEDSSTRHGDSDLDTSWTSMLSSITPENHDPADTSYVYEDDQSDSEAESEISSSPADFEYHRGNQSERFFAVGEAQLMELFQVCFWCLSPAFGTITQIYGSMIKVEQSCGVCGKIKNWKSQSMIGSIPAGNFQLSCGILFSGCLPAKSLRVFNFMNMPCISTDTFLKHQKHYLQPAIMDVWEKERNMYVEDKLKSGNPICIGGDGRCDTPGHSAKFGSYSVMDLDEGLVIDVQLVQSNEVKSSCHMEKEGLARSVAFLQDHGIDIEKIVTDRHVQIIKWVRENLTETKHCVDVWHVAKGLKKKLLALSKEKDCSELTPWIKSITNHLYWTAASTPNGDGALMMQKWISLENHIQNIHEGHGPLFSRCEHGDLTGQGRRKRWLKPGTKSLEKLTDILNSRQMRKDIPMLSTLQQTSELEGYHSVINHFAPKMHGFSYHGMMCRLVLAAMHFNENGRRDIAVTNQGAACYKLIFPKHKKGNYTVREVKTDATYDYVQDLMDNAIQRVSKMTMAQAKGTILQQAPPPLCSEFDRPNKELAVSILRSRFGKPLAAICHGAWMFCSAKILKDKKVTCFIAIKDDVENAGGLYEDSPVVVDGNMITSRFPNDLPEFCKEILRQLKK